MAQVETEGMARSADGLWGLLFASWMVALVSTLAALFIGEVMGQMPCVLCWYQRIFMFPLAIILAIASFRSDAAVWRYALPLAIGGWLIAAFHMLQYVEVMPASIVPCSAGGPPCSGEGMSILGGIPVPALSLAAFTAIAILLARVSRRAPA